MLDGSVYKITLRSDREKVIRDPPGGSPSCSFSLLIKNNCQKITEDTRKEIK